MENKYYNCISCDHRNSLGEAILCPNCVNGSLYAADISMTKAFLNSCYGLPLKDNIADVKFNGPATIVLWKDGTKTVVKNHGEYYDPEKGLAMAIAKKALGNKGNYFEVFKMWIPLKEKSYANCFKCDNRNIAPTIKPCSECEGHSNFASRRRRFVVGNTDVD